MLSVGIRPYSGNSLLWLQKQACGNTHRRTWSPALNYRYTFSIHVVQHFPDRCMKYRVIIKMTVDFNIHVAYIVFSSTGNIGIL